MLFIKLPTNYSYDFPDTRKTETDYLLKLDYNSSPIQSTFYEVSHNDLIQWGYYLHFINGETKALKTVQGYTASKWWTLI